MRADKTIRFADIWTLARLGVDVSRYRDREERRGIRHRSRRSTHSNKRSCNLGNMPRMQVEAEYAGPLMVLSPAAVAVSSALARHRGRM